MNNFKISLLKDAYCGETSEMFCILQMSYFAYTASGLGSDFAEIFLNIVEDEERHQKILGKFIVEQGGDLEFDVEKFKHLYFTKNIKNMLEKAIDLKEKCIINYKLLLTKISDVHTKNITKNIVADEQKHILWLRDALEKYTKNH